MAEQTGIEWCDATFNPWAGCEKVSPGCAHCYAETLVTGRMGRAGTWGPEGTRERTSAGNWAKPGRWNQLAADGRLPNGQPNEDGHRPRVFCSSLADVFEPRPELEPWRADLFDVIGETPNLDWLVLTKRPEFARTWLRDTYYGDDLADVLPNLWMGTSIENSRHTWRADVLRTIPAAVRFLSCEPLLGSPYDDHRFSEPERSPLDLAGIDWVIVGGESGAGARPVHPAWARELRDACLDSCPSCRGIRRGDSRCDARPAFFFKQWGEYAPATGRTGRVVVVDPNGHTRPASRALPAPGSVRMEKLGKKAAGRTLDGREWTEYPRPTAAGLTLSGQVTTSEGK